MIVNIFIFSVVVVVAILLKLLVVWLVCATTNFVVYAKIFVGFDSFSQNFW